MRYDVHLELDDGGRCMAHVPELPGCFARASSRDAALRQVGAAIRAYHAWLRRHGEPAPPEDESFEIELAEEIGGTGPFDPGDAAALFRVDKEPVTSDELERCLRLMAHARADLLVLARGLSDGVFDWQEAPGTLTIRRLLRHVGNAEEWYVSRIVPAETLPPEWERDEDLPIFEFLEVERRTAVGELRGLTDAERSGVFHPARWTDHPEEPWTARKVLRRFLEHEREHTDQARQILFAWWQAEGRRARTGPKGDLVGALTAARGELLEAAASIAPEERALRPVCGEWSLKDVIGHVTDWEWVGVEGLRDMAAGQSPQVEHVESLDAWNRAHCEARRDQPWDEVRADFQAAREALLETLGGMGQDALAESFPFPWGVEGTAYQWVGVYVAHDWEHARDLGEGEWQPG